MADDTKILEKGETEIQARDTSPSTDLTIDATDTVVTTTSRTFQRLSAACPTQPTNETDPGPDAGTLDARQFFAVRDTVNFVDPDPTGQEDRTPAANDLSEFQTLFVFRPI